MCIRDRSFVLDVSDLFRDTITIPAAFSCASIYEKSTETNIERLTRKKVGQMIRKEKLVDQMIGRIKQLFEKTEKDVGD